MKVKLQQVSPAQIEARSMEIISQELGGRHFAPLEEQVIKRVIHTTADFDYADSLTFSPGAVQQGIRLLRQGVTIVTDTRMAQAGINKPAAERFGCRVLCFMGDEDVAAEAKARGCTRAAAAMEKAARLPGPVLFAVGNAPTALVRLYELASEERLIPAMVIGVPVGFVNVVEAKELLCTLPVPQIVARGRKGGSNVAAAIVNAMLYEAGGRD